LSQRSCIYFLSDIHLGIDTEHPSHVREQALISWLNAVKEDAKAIYIVGDLFDYWFEYKSVVPKGYFELFSATKAIVDSGIRITYLTGNHDLWHYGYLSDHIGIQVLTGPITESHDGRKFYITHGDGIGKGDLGYKIIKAILSDRLCQWLFSVIHPTLGLPLMKYMSKRSRMSHSGDDNSTDHHHQYCREVLAQQSDIDYFIMGHLHIAEHTDIGSAAYINLGDWTSLYTYAKWDGNQIQLLCWDINS
jgi:UDP-2,3-diacylglucosamine hydrolase